MPKSKSTSEFKISAKSKDLPATQGMLYLVRSELKADTRELRSEMKAGFKLMDSKFDQVDSRFNRIDAKFSQIDARFNQVDARFNQVDARFKDIDARFNQVDARFNRIDARFDQMDAKLENVLSEVSRIGVVVEEQNSRNTVVLEAVVAFIHRQDRQELRMNEVENTVQGLAVRSRR